MRALTDAVRSLGFRWGSYSNMAGCQVAACDIPSLKSSAATAFVTQDAALYLDEWKSDYLMVDSVGVTAPAGSDRHAWIRDLVARWAGVFRDYARPGGKNKSITYHSCHAGCGGAFSGPALQARRCSTSAGTSNPAQLWAVADATAAPADAVLHLRSKASGLCVGCTNGPCTLNVTSPELHGFGLQSCAEPGMGSDNQQWAYNVSSQQIISPANHHQPPACLARVESSSRVLGAEGTAVVAVVRARASAAAAPATQWSLTKHPASPRRHGHKVCWTRSA